MLYEGVCFYNRSYFCSKLFSNIRDTCGANYIKKTYLETANTYEKTSSPTFKFYVLFSKSSFNDT